MKTGHRYTWTVVTSSGVRTHLSSTVGQPQHPDGATLALEACRPTSSWLTPTGARWTTPKTGPCWSRSIIGYHCFGSLPLTPPPNPFHMTLFYDPTSDLTYQSWFNQNLEGQIWEVGVPGIVLGPEGAAAPRKLSPERSAFHRLGPPLSSAFDIGNKKWRPGKASRSKGCKSK